METNYTLWALGRLMDIPPLVICDSGNYDDIDWCEIPENKRPTKAAVLEEIENIKTIVEPEISYRHNRAISYPQIGDQLDALFHAGAFPEDMAEKIQAVKDQFPKPGANI